MNNTHNTLAGTFASALIILLATFGTVQAQTIAAPLAMATADTPDELALTSRENNRTEAVNTSAFYPGGEAALSDFMQAEVSYPEIAQENNFEGTTKLVFEVLADGSIGAIRIAKSTHAICDAEVVKALNKMGKWEPAKENGRKVKSWRSVEVNFYLR